VSSAPKVKVFIRGFFDFAAPGKYPRMPRYFHIENLSEEKKAVV
jgi:hypothetical protein